MELIELSIVHMRREDTQKLFRSKAAGVFFNDMPMRFYGGTALSCTCACVHMHVCIPSH